MSAVLEKDLVKNRFQSFVHPSYELEQRLLRAIKAGDLSEGDKILQKINSFQRAQLSNTPIQSLRYSLVGSCTLFTRACIECGVHPETAFTLSDNYINLIDTNTTKKNIQDIEFQMLEGFITLIKSQKTYLYSPPINKTIKYIKNNIEEKLTLNEIADFINVHPNYLSTIFKKEVGKTILEYINEEKITSIKSYLIHTNVPISEISTTFNFSTPSYFSKYFKLHTTLTPFEYRSKNIN